ncbi:MAG: metallophosphoesterase [Nostocoides sp.]
MTSAARATATTVGAVVATAALGTAYASVIERNWFALREFTVAVLPPGASSLRVLQISDIHLVPGQDRKLGWIHDLATLAPDFVVNTGDNLSHVDAVPPLLAALEPLLGLPGVFVLGSNDYYAPTPRNPARYLVPRHAEGSSDRRPLPTLSLVRGLSAGGWVDLDNARTSVTLRGQRLDLVGVDDPHIKRDEYAAVSAPASPSAALTVGVVHAPYQRVLDAMTADGASLVIAGHTHGGQLAVPGYGALVTNCDLDRSRAKGLSRWWPGAGVGAPRHGLDRVLPGRTAWPSSSAPADAAYLHVSAGLGTSRFAPVRFACRPEATLLTLTARAA